MSIQNKELYDFYLRNEEMWKLWQKHGVTETTPLEVDFHFISKKKEYASKFTQFLIKSGYKVIMNEFSKKSFFIVKIWNIELTLPQQTWTLDKLNQQSKEFYQLAKNYGCSIDGNGAMIPD